MSQSDSARTMVSTFPGVAAHVPEDYTIILIWEDCSQCSSGCANFGIAVYFLNFRPPRLDSTITPLETTAWSALISPSYLNCVVVGPLSHHLVWTNGDGDGSFYLVAFSGFLLHTLHVLASAARSCFRCSFLLLLLVPVTTFSAYAYALSSTHNTLSRLESLYLLSILLSIAIYRAFFHPLTRAGFSGPLLSRLTIFHWVFLTLWSKHRHALVLQHLHAQYNSDIVRIGPNHLSILSASSIDVIHGKNSRCTQGVAYENPMGRCVNWDRDPKSHAERRRVWDRALGKEAREAYYERIQGLTVLLMMRLREASP